MKDRVSACRSLFGPVDHDQLRRDLQLRLREITERDSRRWNFNFASDTPLRGPFQWEEIPAGSGPSHVREEARLSPAEETRPAAASDAPKRSAELKRVQRKRSLSRGAAKTGTGARITDFFPKRRRSTETKNILNPFHKQNNEAALRKTLR